MKNWTLNPRLLAIIGRRLPAIYDVIGPLPDPWLSKFAAVALNPQPLPPGPTPDKLGAAIAAEFMRNVWLAERFGQDQQRFLSDLDDWCPTHPGKRLKLPPWWPPLPDPEPHPNWYIDLHLGFAARLATASIEGTHISETIDKAIERSMNAVESIAAKHEMPKESDELTWRLSGRVPDQPQNVRS